MRAQTDTPKYLAGLLVFLFVHASLALLLLSPWLEDPVGKYRDEKLMATIDEQIREVRTGPVTIFVKRQDGTPIKGVQLEYRLKRHDFLFGCNIFMFDKAGDPGKNELYKKYFADLFNTAVLPFYWSRYEPRPGEFPTDRNLGDVLDWCENQGITPKGHPLMWRNPAGYPDWLPDDKTRQATLMQARINKIIGEYRDRIRIWDVVNEPTHLPPFGHESVYEYVSNALLWAHEADPDAVLTVNDYGIMGHDFGHGPFHRLIDKLLKNRAPLKCIGFQGHEPRTDWIPATELRATIDAYANFGLPIHVTEITVPSDPELPITNSWKKGVWTQDVQAEYLERFYKICFANPAMQGIIHWDLSDADSWVVGGGLIGKDWKPKPAYHRLHKLIKEDWTTKGSAKTDGEGKIEFAGFYGNYEFHLPAPGITVPAAVKKGRENSFLLTLP